MTSKEMYEILLKREDLQDIHKMALKNCIAIFVTGSHLYGTETKDSDFDFEGVFVEDEDYIIGTKKVEEVDFSTNTTHRKNTHMDIDVKFYSLSKYLKLLKQGNPNKLETLFIPKHQIFCPNPNIFDEITKNKDLFINTNMVNSYLGYARGQFKRYAKGSHNTISNPKGIMHAFRLLDNVQELAFTKKLKLPCINCNFYKEIRGGDIPQETLIYILKQSFDNTEIVLEQFRNMNEKVKDKEINDLQIRLFKTAWESLK